jgi:hypothetical protein
LMGNVSNTTFPTEMFRNKGRGIRVWKNCFVVGNVYGEKVECTWFIA